MDIVQFIFGVCIIAAVIFYFYKRSKWMKEQETEERLRDLFR